MDETRCCFGGAGATAAGPLLITVFSTHRKAMIRKTRKRTPEYLDSATFFIKIKLANGATTKVSCQVAHLLTGWGVTVSSLLARAFWMLLSAETFSWRIWHVSFHLSKLTCNSFFSWGRRTRLCQYSDLFASDAQLLGAQPHDPRRLCGSCSSSVNLGGPAPAPRDFPSYYRSLSYRLLLFWPRKSIIINCLWVNKVPSGFFSGSVFNSTEASQCTCFQTLVSLPCSMVRPTDQATTGWKESLLLTGPERRGHATPSAGGARGAQGRWAGRGGAGCGHEPSLCFWKAPMRQGQQILNFIKSFAQLRRQSYNFSF